MHAKASASVCFLRSALLSSVHCFFWGRLPGLCRAGRWHESALIIKLEAFHLQPAGFTIVNMFFSGPALQHTAAGGRRSPVRVVCSKSTCTQVDSCLHTSSLGRREACPKADNGSILYYSTASWIDDGRAPSRLSSHHGRSMHDFCALCALSANWRMEEQQ